MKRLVFAIVLAMRALAQGSILVVVELDPAKERPKQGLSLIFKNGMNHEVLPLFPPTKAKVTLTKDLPYGDYVVEAQLGGRYSATTTVRVDTGSTKPVQPSPLTVQAPLAGLFDRRPGPFGGVRITVLSASRQASGTPVPGCGAAELEGVVRGGRGQALAGVEVAALYIDVQQRRVRRLGSTLTDRQGQFRFGRAALPSDQTYFVFARLPGYQPESRVMDGCSVPAREWRLDPEAAVMAGVTADTTDGAGRRIYPTTLLAALPLAGFRSTDQLALLSPGVVPAAETPGPAGPGLAPGVGSPGPFSANGLRGRDGTFTIDGADNNDEEVGSRRQGFLAPAAQSVEAAGEFQLLSSFPSARYGRSIGPQLNLLTRRGTGELHGGLYGFTSSHRWNARDFFTQSIAVGAPGPVTHLMDGQPVGGRLPAPGKDPFFRMQSGITLGGPVRRPDLAFFVNYEQLRRAAAPEQHFVVPAAVDRGAYGSGGRGLPVFGGLLQTYPASLPGNAILSLYPFPNNPAGPYGARTYSTRLPADGRAHLAAGKLDRFAGSHARGQTISARWNLMREGSTLPAPGGALWATADAGVQASSAAVTVASTLSPRATNTARFSFGRTAFDFTDVAGRSPLASRLPAEPFLLNAPLLLNLTRTPSVLPQFASASSTAGQRALALAGLNGVADSEALTGPLGEVRLAGFSPLGADVYRLPQRRADYTLQVGDAFSWVSAKQVWRAGFDLRWLRLNSAIDRNARPLAEFHGVQQSFLPEALDVTSPLSMAAMGAPTGLFQTLVTRPAESLGLRAMQGEVFGLWEATLRPKLRADAGVRLNLNPLPRAVDNQILRGFDPALLESQIQRAEATCRQPCANLFQPLRQAFPASFADVFGAQRKDVDVRAGLAWDPSGTGATVLRVRAGTFSGPFPAVVVTEGRSGFPDALPLNLSNLPVYSSLTQFPTVVQESRSRYLFNLANPAVRALNPAFAGLIRSGTLNQLQESSACPAAAGLDPVALLANCLREAYPMLAPVAPAAGLRSARAYQFGAGLDQRLPGGFTMHASYLGTQGRHLLRASTPDAALRTFLQFTGPVQPSASGFPIFVGDLGPNILDRDASGAARLNAVPVFRTLLETSARSTYHALQADLRRSYRNGLLLGVAFTYGHALDDASDFFDLSGSGRLPQNSARPSERGSANFDVRLRTAAHFVWTLPAAKGKWSHALTRAWMLSGIYTLQSGQPFTVNSVYDINLDGNLTDRLGTTEGLDLTANGPSRMRLRPGVSPFSQLAPLARISPNTGLVLARYDGAVGRNTFRGDGVQTLDLALARELAWGERVHAQLRGEAFNAANHANFALPVRMLEAPGFGQAVRTSVPGRTINFALRLSF